jgi:hypothetical protein
MAHRWDAEQADFYAVFRSMLCAIFAAFSGVVAYNVKRVSHAERY